MATTAAPISVLIPAHNEEQFLAEAIQSVHAQKLQPAEIIVIADACTDRTSQIAADLGAVILETERHNMAAALNLGVQASTQTWIAMLDADDFWDKRKLALQWQAIQSFPDAALISCDLSIVIDEKVFPTPSRHLRERWQGIEHKTFKRYYHYLETVPGAFLPRFNMGTPTVMLRRDVFSHVGLFSEDLIYGQTLEFFARVAARYPIAFVERPLVFHRRHDHNLTHRRNLPDLWPMLVSIANRMLNNPGEYPQGAGAAYRERLKEQFVQFERFVAREQRNVDGQSGSRT